MKVQIKDSSTALDIVTDEDGAMSLGSAARIFLRLWPVFRDADTSIAALRLAGLDIKDRVDIADAGFLAASPGLVIDARDAATRTLRALGETVLPGDQPLRRLSERFGSDDVA